ncbi:hypothetical protein OUHCRE19_26090 [Enterobacter asburiae]|uniref:hypothetical protein n=1 Tax=Enterobacteriaceae TaxID=543 RepID=UPI0015AF4901|nr:MULTISPECIES: hypothetical protein [Enterobacteriaceae]MBJ8976602.1 hypothetical protein [Citrobacter freundii]MBJ9013479.1 hypothetical protein [Citrobacter freundii]MDV0600603.1 hypothetical protein [Raoultella ornithinolytica]
MRPRILSENDVIRLASKWLAADTEGKKELLKETGIAKTTLYRSMERFGLSFVKSLN